MPKLSYTSQKGLVQSRGSGLSLLSDMDGQRRARKSVTAVGSLSADDSGKIITLTGTAFTLSLPAVGASAGCHYSVVVGQNGNYVISEDTATDSGVLTMVVAAAAGSTRADAFETATLNTGVIGDHFEIYSNGTQWVISAFTNAAITAAGP